LEAFAMSSLRNKAGVFFLCSSLLMHGTVSYPDASQSHIVVIYKHVTGPMKNLPTNTTRR
jgi:hypothetical protein